MKGGYIRAILLALIAFVLVLNFYSADDKGFEVSDTLHTLLILAVPLVLVPWVLYRWNTRQRRKVIDRYKVERD